MVDKRDVELIIRAKDFSSKTFKEVAGAVGNITTALDGQISAAKKGEISFKALEQTYKQLKEAGEAIIKQQGLIDHFNNITKQIEAQEAKAKDARAAFEAMQASLSGAETTRAQERQLASLEKAANTAEGRLTRLQTSLAAQTEKLERAGLATKNLDGQQQALVSTAAQIATAIGTTSTAMEQYETNLRLAREAEKQIGQVQSLQQAGAQAIEAANAVRGFDSAVEGSASATSRIASSLRAILDPSAEAVRSLDGLETEVSRLTAQVGNADKPLRDYQDAIYDLQRAQQAILKSAGDIDAYKTQEAAVQRASKAYIDAKGDLLAYAQQAQAATEPNEALAASLAQAETRFEQTGRALKNEETRLAALARALQAAGIDVKDLSKAEERLTTVSNQTAGAVQKLDAAAKGQGSAAGRFLGLRPYELQNFYFQINDIFTQIASGTSVLQTLAQQGGQVVQLFPQFFAGLIPLAPYILAVGGALALVFSSLNQILELEASQRKFEGQLRSTADAARYSAENLAEISHELDAYAGSLEDARAAVSSFVKEGLNPAIIEQFAWTAQDVADVTGKKLPDAAKAMADAFSGGYEEIKKLDDEFNFLTASERDHIKDMFDSQRQAEARTEAFEIFRKKMNEAAGESRSDWTVAVRDLTQAWDGFLHTLGNTSLIEGAAERVRDLADVVRGLTDMLPKAEQRAATASAGQKAKEKPQSTSAGLVRSAVLNPTTPFAPLVGALAFLKLRGQVRKTQEDQAKQASAQAKAVAAQTDTIDDSSQKAKKAGDAVLDQMREEHALRDNEISQESEKLRIQAARLKAQRQAQSAGADAAGVRAAADLAEQYERQEIAKKRAQKAEQERRKADAAARKEDAKARREEETRTRLQAELVNDLRQQQGNIEKEQTVSLEARLNAIDLAYAKVFDTLQKAKKAGVTTVQGMSLDEFAKTIEANKEILKDQESMKFADEQINLLLKQRDDRLQAIRDEVAAGNLTAVQGYAAASQFVGEITPKINEVATTAAEFAKSLRGLTPDPKLEAFIAKMERLGRSGVQSTNAPQAKLGTTLLNEQETELTGLVQQRTEAVQNANRLYELGMITQAQAQSRARAAYNDTNGLIQTQLTQMRMLVEALHEQGSITDIVYKNWIAKLDIVGQEATYVDERFTKIKQTLQDAVTGGVTNFIDSASEAIGKAITKTTSWGDALESVGQAALAFGAQFLKALADILTQMLILEAIKNLPFFNSLATGIMDFAGLTTGAATLATASATLTTGATAATAAGGSITAGATALGAAAAATTAAGGSLLTAAPALLAAAAAISAAAAALQVAATTNLAASSVGVLHSGGIAGLSSRSRSVSPAIFAGAPRYHSGGIAGLAPDEVGAVLRKGEEVLTQNDPRHRSNGGLSAGKGGQQPQGERVKNVILFDPEEAAAQMLSTRAGERAMLTVVGRNPRAFQAALSGRKS